MTEEAKRIIQDAINNPEFVSGIAEALDFFETIKRAYQTDNVIVLESVVKALERRIVELNIMFCFRRINKILN